MTQDPQRLYELAVTAQKTGDLAETERCWRALADLTGAAEALVNHANALGRLGRHAEALARYDAAVAANDRLAPAWFNRANLLAELKRAEEALADYDRAAALSPAMSGIWNNRGAVLRALNRHAAALESFRRAVALDGGHVNAAINIAIALYDLRLLPDALAAADQALALRPGFAEALHVKANILSDMGRAGEALENYEAALAANPRHAHALNGAATAALNLCDWDRVAAFKPRLEEEVRLDRAAIQPFTLLGYGAEAGLQRACAEHWIARSVPRRAPLWRGERYGHDRIRLAYLSADFHQHPTAVLTAELFERHDRGRFDVTAISFGPDDGSPMRARLVRAFDRFEDVRGRSDAEVARLMRQAEIDIAVDLNGHTLHGRPEIFAWRPAPVAVNWLVYPGTTGAPFLDVILADRLVLPLARQPQYSEKIVHLLHCYQPNDATRAIAPAPPRAECGLPESSFVFCCFNAGWKITAPVFDIWMRLLEQVYGGVLWLLDGPQAANLRREAAARGVDADRLVFAPKIEPSRHLARHRIADLFLDTWPYGAHTTASDALWAGLPLVTCMGADFPARVGASLLENIGLPELVTQTPRAYETLALELARDPARLAGLREKLARNRTTAPLFDSAGFARAIEAVYGSLIA